MNEKCLSVVITLVLLQVNAFGQAGIFDLRNQDLAHEAIPLSGTWIFYKNQLINPDQLARSEMVKIPTPPIDGFIFGTYQTKVILPEKHGSLSLHIAKRYTSCRVWINSRLEASVGEIVPDFTGPARIETRGFVVPLPHDIDTLLITIQVSNLGRHHHGLVVSPIVGPTDKVIDLRLAANIKASLFICCLILLAAYSLTQFFLYGRATTYLFLALIALAIATRAIAIRLLPTLVPFSIITRIEFTAAYSLLLLFPVYIVHLFKDELRKWIFRSLLFIGFIFVIFVLTTPYHFYRATLDYAHVMFGLEFIYAVIIIARNYRRMNKDFRYVLVGIIVAIPLITLEILHNSEVIQLRLDYLIEIGLLQFLFLQAILLHEKHQKELADLKVVNDELDEFLYRTSHDFKTPISSILGLSHILEVDRSEANVIDCNREIKKNAHRMDNLLRDIAVLTALNKNTEWGVEPIPIRSLLEDVIKTKVPSTVECKVDIIQQGAFTNNAYLMKELLLRIFDNAATYIDEHKARKYIEVTARVEGSQLSISVLDNGIGLPAELLKNIFNKFYKGTSRSVGSGLGLFIVKRIVDQLGGQVFVHSKPNEWFRVDLVFPADPVARV